MTNKVRYFIILTNCFVCTAYRTEEAAMADGERMAKLFGEKFLRVERREI